MLHCVHAGGTEGAGAEIRNVSFFRHLAGLREVLAARDCGCSVASATTRIENSTGCRAHPPTQGMSQLSPDVTTHIKGALLREHNLKMRGGVRNADGVNVGEGGH